MGEKTYNVSDFMRAAAQQQKVLETAMANFNRRRGEHKTRMEELRVQCDEALAGLARLILPVLSTEAVQKAARLSAYGPLYSSDPVALMESERGELQAGIAAMEADPRYAERFALRAPGVGKLARELQELEEYRSSINADYHRADHRRLARLLETGYGTDQYAVRWWQLAFYADWKAGDEILEKFPDYKSFGALREELLKMRDDLSVYDRKIGELRAEIEAGEKLEKDHDAAALRFSNLAAIHLDEWQKRLARHVEASPEVVAERLSGETDLEALLKTAVGLRKKKDYLEQLAVAQIEEPAGKLELELAKLEHDRVKFSRPKRAGELFPAEVFEKRFRDRDERFGKHFQRYDSASRTICDFSDYGRGSLSGDFLWWDLLTDGRVDGDFITEVEEFRHKHPDYAWHSERFDDDGAAAAAAAADRLGPDSGLTTDAS